MSIPPAHSLLLLPLLLMPLLDPRLHLPLVEADISGQYHNYNQNSTVCGMSPLNKRVNESLLPVGRSAPYVANGQDVEYGEWPFVAWITLGQPNLCTGVIVTNEIVVTAGHCLAPFGVGPHGKRTRIRPDMGCYVTVGKISFHERDKYEKSYDIRAIQEGAYFRKRGFSEIYPDFARLWLYDRIEFNDYVLPVCILSDPEEIYSLMSGPLHFMGNGYKEAWPNIQPNRTQHTQMIQADSFLPPVKMYSKEIKSKVPFIPHDKQYRGTCPGDSGGPLVALDKNKRWSLIAILASSNTDCFVGENGVLRSYFVVMAKIVGIFDSNFKPKPDEDAAASIS